MPSSSLTIPVTETFFTPAQINSSSEITSAPTPTVSLTPENSPFLTMMPPTVYPTNIITSSQLITETLTPEPTETSQWLDYTSTLSGNLYAYMSIIIFETLAPIEIPIKYLFCDQPGSPISIPDNNASGIVRSLIINDNRYIADLDVIIDITHVWVGDIILSLELQ